MKKTILATMLTSLFAATTAHSAMMHDADGISVELYGDVEVQAINTLDEDEGKKIKLDEANFGVKAIYDINDDVAALGVISFESITDNNNSNGATLDDAYVGFSSGEYGTITAGKQVTIFDDAGIGGDYQFGFNDFYEQTTSSEQVIKYTVDKGNYYGGIAYIVNQNDDDNLSGVDGKLGIRFSGVDLTVFYGIADQDDGSGETENLNLEARYTIDQLTLAAAYATTQVDGENDVDSVGLAATYQVNSNVQLAVGYANIDEDNMDDVNQYYANASYAFSSNVNTYFEIGGNDDDNTELGYVAGMAISF